MNHSPLGFGKRLAESLDLARRPSCVEVLSRRLHELRLGLELEYLVVDSAGAPIRSSSYHKVIQALLVALPNARLKDVDGIQILVCELKQGVILEVKPDFAFNVVELSLGILTYGTFKEITPVILGVFFETLERLGFQAESRSVSHKRRDEIEIVPLPRLAGYLEKFIEDRESLVGKPWYPGEIASMQVHVDALTNDFFDLAPNYFIQEFIFNRWFNFSESFVRSTPELVGRFENYEKSLGDKYVLKTIPDKIYDGLAEYEAYADRSIPYFDQDPVAPVRDLTFVRPRSFGTIEFRSACANSDYRVLEDLLLRRIAQVITGMGVLGRDSENRKSFIEQSRKLWMNEKSGLQSQLSRDVLHIHEKVLSKVREELNRRGSIHSLGALAA